ncbi:uncharacterized protein L201_005375 [Kwoniella dendrophila CBS 6074]|uniref:WSC domain-containing protein n=1 Tax=Kwoniella dendrophila CBS 6074 TaxID=1295534 RepID=A0AAX4K0Y1_9TREE
MLHYLKYHLLTILPAIFTLFTLATADNLFVGCGDGMHDVERTIPDTANANACYNACKSDPTIIYYTLKPNKDCICYKYPPPPAEFMPGGPNQCNNQMQYNLIKSSWNFLRCYESPPAGLTEVGSDGFRNCMDVKCKSNEIALARPRNIYPGTVYCICTSEAKLAGLKQVTCDYKRYYAYKHKPNTKRIITRESRPLAIAERNNDIVGEETE